ncbi:MAG: hypothetical protein ACOZNI_23455 [Myxococcota bacterium]
MIPLALLPHALAWTSASTTATAGGCTVVGVDGAAIHEHGGPAARIGEAQFEVRRDAATALRVDRVEFLAGSDGRARRPPPRKSGPKA